MQQKLSAAQIAAAHGPQPLLSGWPWLQTGCAQFDRPHKPWSQPPMQHSAGVEQDSPFAKHWPWQTPLAQLPEQQSPGPPQGCPFGSQVAAPQVPLVHAPLQQLPGAEQAVPSGSHCPPPPQSPSLHEPEQHSVGEAQPKPSLWQTGWVQRSSSHSPLQQELPKSQSWPAARHVAWQLPSEHTPEQHSEASTQAPKLEHALEPPPPSCVWPPAPPSGPPPK